MSTRQLNPPSRPIAALDRATGAPSTTSQTSTMSRSQRSRMQELDAKITDVKSQIDGLNDELKILVKEKELEKQKELLRERTLLVEEQRAEVERLKDAHRLFEEARLLRNKRLAEAAEEAACRKRQRTEKDVIKIELD